MNAYASTVCMMYEPCCESESLGYDGAGCTTWFRKVTAAYFRGSFRQDAADSCLAALAQAFAADAQRCANVLDFDQATLRASCQLAFGADPHAGKALGEKCLSASECMSATGDGAVICYGGACTLQKTGAAGDGPCFLSGNTNPRTEFFTCDAQDGLYCHRANNVCTQQVGAGEACPYANACKDGATCAGGQCVTLPGPGDACLNAIRGAGGTCRPGSACDVDTLLCGDALLEGATCREPGQCASRSCMGTKCTKPEFTRALNCTGGR